MIFDVVYVPSDELISSRPKLAKEEKIRSQVSCKRTDFLAEATARGVLERVFDVISVFPMFLDEIRVDLMSGLQEGDFVPRLELWEARAKFDSSLKFAEEVVEEGSELASIFEGLDQIPDTDILAVR